MKKFIYVALSRTPSPLRPARVLRRPELSKIAIAAKLCTSQVSSA